jgi:hypothetical protein
MNFVSLLMHGLNAISVFSDQVSARLLTATAAFALVTGCVGTLGPIGCRVAGERLPGWLPFAVAALLVMALQTLAFATVFVFTVANRRSATGFILQRDAPYFILGKTTIRERPQLEKLSRALAAWSRVEVQQNPGGNA